MLPRMLNSGKEILDDIDATIDQLIANASAMKCALTSDLAEEIEALEKTQESLLARLIHRHTLLQSEKRKLKSTVLRKEQIQKRILNYGKTHAKMIAEVSKQLGNKQRPKPLKMSKRAKRCL